MPPVPALPRASEGLPRTRRAPKALLWEGSVDEGCVKLARGAGPAQGTGGWWPVGTWPEVVCRGPHPQ